MYARCFKDHEVSIQFSEVKFSEPYFINFVQQKSSVPSNHIRMSDHW
jgi:hypothetical protein